MIGCAEVNHDLSDPPFRTSERPKERVLVTFPKRQLQLGGWDLLFD